MNRNATVVACFFACLASVGVAAGTATPVLYGAGEATTSVTATGVLSTLTALVSGAGGLFALLRSSPLGDFAKGAIGNLASRDVGGSVLDAAFVTIAATLLAKRGSIDPTMLAELGALRKKIDGDSEVKK